MKKTYSRAFTLIELLVVIAIIGILTGIIVTNLSQSRAKARDAKRISDIGQIQLALELYYDRCKQYPATTVLEVVDINSLCTINNTTVNLISYISKIPDDPNGASYNYLTLLDSVGKAIDYVLHASLEGYNEVIKDNPSSFPSGSWSPAAPSTLNCINLNSDKEYCVAPR